MKNKFQLISFRGIILPIIIFWFVVCGCSSQDANKKELPPVTEKVTFTPSESSNVKPVGMDGK